MALLNELDVTTRRGNSAARDTTPELSWSSSKLDVTWINEDVDLGCDHSVIGITIRDSRYRAVLRTMWITDWDKMRKSTQGQEEASEEESEQNERKQTYTEWARNQKKALQKFTQEIGPALVIAVAEASETQQKASQAHSSLEQTDRRARGQAMQGKLAEDLRWPAGQALGVEDVASLEASDRPAE
ncbi:hypothetical protein MTO96_006352 [Rhipicephalus appendiculatus]